MLTSSIEPRVVPFAKLADRDVGRTDMIGGSLFAVNGLLAGVLDVADVDGLEAPTITRPG